MNSVTITKKDNKALYNELAFVAAAANTDKTRYYLRNAILFVETDDGVIAVSTDGHRMHLTNLQCVRGADAMAAGLYTVEKRADLISLKVYEGDVTFPDWKRVVPEKNGSAL
jgi:hypothetical protein